MTNPGIFIRGLRQGRNADREQLAVPTGISSERQRLIEEGYAIPSLRERRAYAAYFGFDGVLDFDENWRARVVPLSKGTADGRIPVINLAPAGNPLDYEESYPNSGIGYAYIDPPPGVVGPNLFAFVIVGKSMEPDYPEGYYAICRPTPADEIEDGAAVFVRFGASRDHTCTFKRALRIDDHRVELRPINPRWKSEEVMKAEIDRMSPIVAIVLRVADGSGESQSRRTFVRDDVQVHPDEV